MKHLCKNESDTIELGAFLGKTLLGGDVVLLSGDLGAGKTTFSKGIAKALGVLDSVTSPTFAIMNLYVGTSLTLCHIDAYRLNSAEEGVFAGLDEFIGDKNTVCIVEWHKNISQMLPNDSAIRVDIKYISENEREIEIVNK